MLISCDAQKHVCCPVLENSTGSNTIEIAISQPSYVVKGCNRWRTVYTKRSGSDHMWCLVPLVRTKCKEAWQGSIWNPSADVRHVAVMVDDLISLQTGSERPLPPWQNRQSRWESPPYGWGVKINADAAFKLSPATGASGVLARDSIWWKAAIALRQNTISVHGRCIDRGVLSGKGWPYSGSAGRFHH
jgi:hypothetical protein